MQEGYEMGGTCSTHEEMRNSYKYLVLKSDLSNLHGCYIGVTDSMGGTPMSVCPCKVRHRRVFCFIKSV